MRKATRLSCSKFQFFLQHAWPHIPGTRPLVWAGHIPLLCDYLEAIWRRKLPPRMAVNIPPECLKSTIMSVAWPAWIWSQNPKAGILGISYDGKLNQRDASNSRMLIASDWYRILWPEVVLRDDQNAKTDYRNTLGGWRISTTIGGRVTGEHPDVTIWDDPLKAQKKNDKRAKEACREFYGGTLSTRGAAKGSIHLIGHQRLAVDDPTSIAIDANKKAVARGKPEPWVIFRLPMKYDPALAMKDYGFGGDWRKVTGELLDPVQFSEAKLEEMYAGMSQLDIDAQHQQDPKVRTGRFFKLEHLSSIDVKDIPVCDEYVRFWDKAATADGGCYTAGVLIGVKRDGINAKFYILDIRRGQWDVDKVEVEIESAARIDAARYGLAKYRVGMEQEPGSGGKLSARVTEKRLRGFRFTAVSASSEGSKETRAEPLARAIAREEVFYPEEQIDDRGNQLEEPRLPTWVPDMLDEWQDFPGSRYKDITDAASGAFALLEGVIGKPAGGTVILGVTDQSSALCKSPGCGRPVAEGSEWCCPNCEVIASFQDGTVCQDHDTKCVTRYFDYQQRI